MSLKNYERGIARSLRYSKCNDDEIERCMMGFRHFKEAYEVVDVEDGSGWHMEEFVSIMCRAASESGTGSIHYDHVKTFVTRDNSRIVTLQPYNISPNVIEVLDRVNLILKYNPYRKKLYRAELSTNVFYHPSVPAVYVFTCVEDKTKQMIEGLDKFEYSYFKLFSFVTEKRTWSGNEGLVVEYIKNYERFKTQYGVVGTWKVPRALLSFIERGGNRWWFLSYRCDGFVTKNGDRIITLSPVGENDKNMEDNFNSLNDGLKSIPLPYENRHYYAEWFTPGFYHNKSGRTVVMRPVHDEVDE